MRLLKELITQWRIQAYNYLQTRKSLRNVIRELQTRCFGIAVAEPGKEAFVMSSIWKQEGGGGQVTLVTQSQQRHKRRRRPVNSEAVALGGH